MSHLIEGSTGLWEVVIGLEVHAQVTSKAKLFSGSGTTFGADPNTQVSFVDAAFPGMLPVINEFCVEQAVRTGLGLNAQINEVSIFDRKNYFYADLPAGYQISQYQSPIVGEGYLDIEWEDGRTKRIGIERLHLEQDAGKSIHDLDAHHSYIDLNRAGVALMEIVSKPDLRSAEEASLYVKKLRSLVRCLGTCDGNMEEGSMRVDVNVSVRRPDGPLGTRAEIKNVNSVRFLAQAVQYEVTRQIDLLESGGTVVQETRLFDANKGITRSMRGKEDAHDYRYFPDPDLPPLVLAEGFVDTIRASLPELPDAKKKRFMSSYGLSSYDASVLVSEMDIADYFEKGALSADPKLFANWMMGDLFATLNRESLSIAGSKVSAHALAQLVSLITSDVISGKIAKNVFVKMWETGKEATSIVEEEGLRQVSDDGAILAVIQSVLAQDQPKVEEYKSGKDKLFGYFVGQVMKAMKGQGNPALINDLLKKALSE